MKELEKQEIFGDRLFTSKKTYRTLPSLFVLINTQNGTMMGFFFVNEADKYYRKVV